MPGQMLIIRSQVPLVLQFCQQRKIAYRLYPLLGRRTTTRPKSKSKKA